MLAAAKLLVAAAADRQACDAASVGHAEVRLRWGLLTPKALCLSIHDVDVAATTRQVPQVRAMHAEGMRARAAPVRPG